MEGNHSDFLTGQHSQSTTHFKRLFHPHFIVGLIGDSQYLETALAQNRLLVAFGRKCQINIGLTAYQFVTNRNHIACGQSELGLEQMQILIVHRTEEAQTRTAYIGIVVSKLGLQAIFHYLVGRFTHEIGCKPPTPSRQIVLYTDIVPFVIVLTFAHPVQETTVTQIEIRNKRFLGKIPFERTACRHESRHTEPLVIGVMVTTIVNLDFIDGIAVTVGKELLDQMLIICLLGYICTTVIGTVGPQHIIIVSAPQTDREIIVFESSPRRRITALHVEAGIKIERTATGGIGIYSRLGQPSQYSMPIVIEKKRGADMLTIAEGTVVMITETTIESNLSIIVGSIVPEVLDHRVTFFRKVFVNCLVQCTQSRQNKRRTCTELRVIA